MNRLLAAFSIMTFALAAAAATCGVAEANDFEAGFRNPPRSAGIRAFWWWLNSNVTAEAITRDLEEMKAKGFSGAMIFDADGSSQRGNRPVPAGPVFGSPEWTELFVHACREAKRLDLELSLNIQSGWNLGGPQVTAEEATQTLVWSKAAVNGPAVLERVLPTPQSRDFYKDVAVIAVPIPGPDDNAQSAADGNLRCTLQAGSSQPDHPTTLAMDGDPSAFRPIKNLNLKSATRELGMSAPDCRFLLDTDPALPGESVVKCSDILILSQKMDDQGTLRWDVPKGDWVILRFGHTNTGAHVSTQSAGWVAACWII